MSADDILKEIEDVVNAYDKLLLKIKKKGAFPKKPADRDALIGERDSIKNTFIQNKKACREAINALSKKKAELRTEQLKELQLRYRNIDEEFKAFKEEETRVNVEKDREELFEGARERKGDGELDLSRTDNKTILNKTKSTAKQTTEKLRTAMTDLQNAETLGREATATLAEDATRVGNVMNKLDEMQSDLVIANKLITGFAKRLYTDKIIIMFTCVVLGVIVGIIVYSVVNKKQSTFSVPDVVKPPT